MTETIKMTGSLNFVLLLLLNQFFKKKIKVAKSNHKSFKDSLCYFESIHYLCQYQYEHEKKQNLLINYNRFS